MTSYNSQYSKISEAYEKMRNSRSMDIEYEESVRRGNVAKTTEIIRKLAKSKFPNTKAVGTDGLPDILYHGGDFGEDGNFVPNTSCGGGMHFGNIDAAERRYIDTHDSTLDDGRILPFVINVEKPCDTADVESLNDWNSDYVTEFGIDTELPSADKAHDGYDGNRYVNVVEDPGSVSFTSYRPNAIKLACATYDDDGNLIPLSKRLDSSSSDARY